MTERGSQDPSRAPSDTRSWLLSIFNVDEEGRGCLLGMRWLVIPGLCVGVVAGLLRGVSIAIPVCAYVVAVVLPFAAWLRLFVSRMDGQRTWPWRPFGEMPEEGKRACRMAGACVLVSVGLHAGLLLGVIISALLTLL